MIPMLLLFAPGAAGEQQNARTELKAVYAKGAALVQQGNWTEGLALLEKATVLADKLYGKDHPTAASYWFNLGISYMQINRVDEAEAIFRRVLTIREKKLGNDHAKVADALNWLGLAMQKTGRLKESQAVFERALEIRKGKLPETHPDLAVSFNNLGTLYSQLGRFREAESLLLRCLTIREAHFGKSHPEVAEVLIALTAVFAQLDRHVDGERAARRSLQIMEHEFGKEHSNTARALAAVARIYQATKRHAQAEPLYRRILEIVEKNRGPNHPEVGVSVGNLAVLLYEMNRYREAEPLFRRALEIAEVAVGKNSLAAATVLHNMGGLYAEIGRHAEAEKVFLRCLQILEAKRGPDDPGLANTMNSLAVVYTSMGQDAKAEAVLRKSIRIREVAFGKEHSALAVNWHNLAHICRRLGRLKEAEAASVRSLQLREAQLGKDHPSVGVFLISLGYLYSDMGQFAQGLEVAERGLRVLKQQGNLGDYSAAHFLLASLYQATDQPEKAWQHQALGLARKQTIVRDILSFNSEAVILSLVESLNVLSTTVSMGASAPTEALSWTLRFKGIALDTLCRYRRTQNVLTPDDPLTERVSQYRALKERLIKATFEPGKDKTSQQQLAQWRRQVQEMEADLNRDLAAKQSDLAGNADNVSAVAVQKRLPTGSALVEFLRSPVRDFKTSRWRESHYFAFVLTPGASPPRLIDLGNADAIDTAVEAVRKEFAEFQEKLSECESPEEARALEREREKQFRKVGAALYERLLGPLQEPLGSAALLYLAPDAALNRLPFEALVDGNGKYLVENRRCAYLSSGRDLLRPTVAPAKGTVVFAGPDYKLDADQRQAQVEKLLGKKQLVALRSLPGQETRSVGWKALPGAAAEARDIHKTLNDSSYGPVTSYVGSEALEEILKAMPAPRVLHLATHGFSLDHQPRPSDDIAAEGSGAGWARGRLRQMDNPLLRSGIVLAGANTIGGKSATANVEDGWVTAEEIALLNLHGTELIVLSACQTGLGDVKSGEGVFGLRRAFLFAGARTLVTSLFEVPDRDTRDLMMHFYRGMQSGKGKLTALHTAQRELIRQRRQTEGAAHPFFWASFVMVGDPD